jgi:hypothetical protein
VRGETGTEIAQLQPLKMVDSSYKWLEIFAWGMEYAKNHPGQMRLFKSSLRTSVEKHVRKARNDNRFSGERSISGCHGQSTFKSPHL